MLQNNNNNNFIENITFQKTLEIIPSLYFYYETYMFTYYIQNSILFYILLENHSYFIVFESLVQFCGDKKLFKKKVFAVWNTV